MTIAPTRKTSTIAAIIPTSGRESVVGAVRSALEQTQQPNAVVVATSTNNAERVGELLGDYGNRVLIETTDIEKPTGGYLRKLGTNAIDCDWYAFLDDDDEWMPGKLEHQLAHVESVGLDVGASTLLFRGPDAVGHKPVPAKLYDESEAVADYLFAGRAMKADRPLLHTSTLLVSREAIQAVNWDPTLALHQDWDLVIRLDDAGFRIGQSAEPLAYVATGTSGSMSATNKWLASHEWWLRSRPMMSAQASSDFLYSQVLRYALRERSWRGVRQVLASSIPSAAALLIALTGLAPRALFEKAMLRNAGAK